MHLANSSHMKASEILFCKPFLFVYTGHFFFLQHLWKKWAFDLTVLAPKFPLFSPRAFLMLLTGFSVGWSLDKEHLKKDQEFCSAGAWGMRCLTFLLKGLLWGGWENGF